MSRAHLTVNPAMATRLELDALLQQLDADVAGMSEDMNNFFRAFEDRAELILGVAEASDTEYVLDRLMNMLRCHGINQRDGYMPPTFH